MMFNTQHNWHKCVILFCVCSTASLAAWSKIRRRWYGVCSKLHKTLSSSHKEHSQTCVCVLEAGSIKRENYWIAAAANAPQFTFKNDSQLLSSKKLVSFQTWHCCICASPSCILVGYPVDSTIGIFIRKALKYLNSHHTTHHHCWGKTTIQQNFIWDVASSPWMHQCKGRKSTYFYLILIRVSNRERFQGK